MIECPSCSTPNAAEARFCSTCGSSLATRVGVQERRVVTALFADLARSTSLGEQLDPEVMRGIVGRFFELAQEQIERRGGTVERFSGDAVMAVFGLPTAHEDDPERAVRAALAIRERMGLLAKETLERHGLAVQARIGIESGEVVVGDPFGGATIATGDALNVAARLEQLAQPDEVIVGPVAFEQVREMVSAEPLGEQQLRGRARTAAAWRVLSISDEVGRPRGVPGLEAPLTGRDEELALLLDAARRAQRERKALLFTILGVPGVGKSRLVREATALLVDGGWSVVRGRCLPYGGGITYWPLVEMIRQLAGIGADTPGEEARDRLAAISPDSEVAGRLALILGTGGPDEGAVEGVDREIAWGFRRLIEHLCTRGGHVLIFEDIHWAEPPLLELIEYVATWTRDVPLLLVCPARPEILDRRAAWGAGRMESTRISLEPLTEEESRAMLSALLTVDDLPGDLRQRVLDRAEGNPLFVEEVVRMLIEEGVVERRDGRWFALRSAAQVRVPDTVEALIRARLDTLPGAERGVLQAASVVGRVFQRSAVAALAQAGSGEQVASGEQVERHLEEAVLRDLITEESSPERDRLFRFRHVLIRDVAYGTLPKARRAELHRRVADWLREWGGERSEEFAEIEAYHLEQAALLRRELDGRLGEDDRRPAVAALFTAAQKAVARDDARAVRNFAERALALEPAEDEGLLELRSLLADAYRLLEQRRAAAELGAEVEREAAAAGRKDLEGRAILAQAGDIWVQLGSPDPHAALAKLERARELLTESGDDLYLSHTLEWLGYRGWWLGDLDDSERLWNADRELARAKGWPSREAEALLRLSGTASQRGQTERWRQLLEEADELARRGTSRQTMVRVKRRRATFEAVAGSAARAEEMLLAVLPEVEELGDMSEVETALTYLGDTVRLLGRPAAALDYYTRAREYVLDHAGRLPETERKMAEVLVDLGRVEEAASLAEQAIKITGADDWATVASTKFVLGRVREAQGSLDEAERLLREAAAIVEPLDFNPWEEQLALAEFLLRSGTPDEGREWLARARASAERYGPQSAVIGWVEQRGATAEAAGAPDR